MTLSLDRLHKYVKPIHQVIKNVSIVGINRNQHTDAGVCNFK